MRISTLTERRFLGAVVGALFLLTAVGLFPTAVAFLSIVFGSCGIALLAMAYEAHLELPRRVDAPAVTAEAEWRLQSPISGLTAFRRNVLAVEVAVVTGSVAGVYGVGWGTVALAVSGAAAVLAGVKIRHERSRVMGWMLSLQLDSQRHVSLRTGHFDGSRIWDLCGDYVYEDSFSGKNLFPLDRVEEVLGSMNIDVLDATLRAQLIQETFETRWADFAGRVKFRDSF